MRRALFLLLLGTPTFAVAGTITATESTINLAQCNGTRDPIVNLEDDLNVDLSWTVTTEDQVPSGDALFRVYASSQQPGAGEGTRVSCTQDADGDAIPDASIEQLGEDIVASSLSSDGTHRYALSALVTAAGLNCTDASTATVYLCVQYLVDEQPEGWARTTLTLDRRRPGAPSNVTVEPGDRALRVTKCDGGTNTRTFRASAEPVGGGTISYSNESGECSSLRFTGLTNGTTYEVVVYGINTAHNPSETGSTPVQGTQTTPVPTNDFWDEYQGADGAEQGGCNTATGAVGILGALALIAAAAAARRRKP